MKKTSMTDLIQQIHEEQIQAAKKKRDLDNFSDWFLEEPAPNEVHECPVCGHIADADDGLGCSLCCFDFDDDDQQSWVE